MPDRRSSVGWRAASVPSSARLTSRPAAISSARRSGATVEPDVGRCHAGVDGAAVGDVGGTPAAATPRAMTYAGTLRKSTACDRPARAAHARDHAADGTSIVTSVSPSARRATRPDSTAHAPSAIVPCPHAVE